MRARARDDEYEAARHGRHSRGTRTPAPRREAPTSLAAAGNRATGQLVQRLAQSFRLSVRIPRSAEPSPERPRNPRGGVRAAAEHDGEDTAADAALAEMAVPDQAPVPAREPEVGERVTLPDLTFSRLENAAEDDAVNAIVPYTPTITQGGAPPNGFGVTRPYTFSLTNVSVTRLPDSWLASAVLDNPITWQVRGAAGPSGQVNIETAADPALNAGNYADAAADLTPDMGDLNGRPPRTDFWSRSLTIQHEHFHCTDGIGHASQGVANAHGWLAAQSAATAAEVGALLAEVPQRVIAARQAGMVYPGREERAYGDGAPAYRALATVIQVTGDLGLYQ